MRACASFLENRRRWHIADIKTKEIDKTPKVKDAAARLPRELIRDIAIKSTDSMKRSAFSQPSSSDSLSEDTAGRLESGMERIADYGGGAVWNNGKKAAQAAIRKKKAISKRNSRQPQAGRDSVKSVEPLCATGQPSADPSCSIGAEQDSRIRIRTKEMDQAQKRVRSAGTGKAAGKGLCSPAEHLKSVGKADRLGKGISAGGKTSGRTYRAGKQLAIRGKQAARKTTKGIRQIFRGVKVVAKTVVTAVRSAVAFVSGGVVVILLIIILGVIGGIAGSSGSSSAEPLSQEVLAYTAAIRRYASQYGIPDYVTSIQAIMMQESGGKGTDPMQASECPYNTRYANRPGAIQDPEYSIQVGVQYYADCVAQAGCESPADLSRLQLSWQGYNYGNGYIGWALTNYGGYSLKNALEFSQQQAASHGWSGYGDPEYVPHVQRYYSGGNLFAGLLGNQQIVNTAVAEIGESSGETYWRWYGFDNQVEWCACFASWCGNKSGLIQNGSMPKFSLCADGVTWFQERGKWQEKGSIPTTGSLIFFDWNGDGRSDHVGIVEKYKDGTIYTVEGNTSIKSGNTNVYGVWRHEYRTDAQGILGYGIL